MQCSLDARSTAQTALQVPVKRVLLPDMAPGRLALTAVRWLEFRAQVVKRPIVGGTIAGIIMRAAARTSSGDVRLCAHADLAVARRRL